MISPYAKRDHVSHVVYDHTSILAFVERRWNLPAMTLRDANANDLTDFLDLEAMRRGQPTFPELPALSPPGESAATLACSRTGPGQIPPPRPPALPAPGLELRRLRLHRSQAVITAELKTSHGRLTHLELVLLRGGRRIGIHRVARVSAGWRQITWHVGHRALDARSYRLLVRAGGRTVTSRRIS